MNEASYRVAEQRLWEHYGVVPKEQRVLLPRHETRVRVMEAGHGQPVLFIHGGPNAGSTWAELVALLPDFRCLVLDRPGTGLSDPLPMDYRTVPAIADSLVADVLDALDIDRAHLVVSSFGGYVAIRSTAASPERVERTVQMGCPGFVPGMQTPGMMKLMAFPGMSKLVPRLPSSEKDIRTSMRHLGHGASIDAGTFPKVFYDWYLALQQHTRTMHNEYRSIARMSTLGGFHDSLTLTPDVISRSVSPTHFIWGKEDPFGGEAVARCLTDLMPSATLDMWHDSGHLPWIDDGQRAATTVRAHLAQSTALESVAD